MTNEQVFALWDSFLKVHCNCHPDEMGNRPCDNGVLCDRCTTTEMMAKYRSALEAGILAVQQARKGGGN